jgi:hypothetical protein
LVDVLSEAKFFLASNGLLPFDVKSRLCQVQVFAADFDEVSSFQNDATRIICVFPWIVVVYA